MLNPDGCDYTSDDNDDCFVNADDGDCGGSRCSGGGCCGLAALLRLFRVLFLMLLRVTVRLAMGTCCYRQQRW